MDEHHLRRLLAAVAAGEMPVNEALGVLRRLPFEDVGGFATLDTHRAVRQGFPEVVYCAGKPPEQTAVIFERLAAHNPRVLGTRATPAHAEAVRAVLPEIHFHADAGVLWLERDRLPRRPGIVLLAAGTSDVPVAEEAALTAELMGHEVQRYYDVGVAGLHRLLARLPALQCANVIVTVAGMEGALPSVVGGLVSCPVIAVPTSVGYGASFGGLAALLTMLNACASGIAVVNIDNGFGGGYIAAMINTQSHRHGTAAEPRPATG
ncbi:MAG: nickel pincer cofactor biosynthesis protein LarB [Ardenticatenaceae bacterium]|nr:nickel pincer cofactor biosynthesis protein LarB [Ardenticatenaceae bacterium]HBY95601.1 nickel pincer cofactor biosynthesis protein LarB [Chloroflexota bacterium]